MISFKVSGAIFDVDDTLLDNKPGRPGEGLHERSRLAAVHEVGTRHGIAALEQLSLEDNLQAIIKAPIHTLEAAVWNILVKFDLAQGDVIDENNELLREIVLLKDELHKDIMLNEAEEVVGATKFVTSLAASGLSDKIAIASSAIRRDVDIFLSKTGLNALFPEDRIKTKESVIYPKPNPEVYNLAFTSLHLPENSRFTVCAFEDDPRGIIAARAAGLYVCGIATRYTIHELLSLNVPPHLVAANYEEFTDLFGL